MTDRTREILRLSTQIVAAHVGHNQVRGDELPRIIHSIYSTLRELAGHRPPFTRASGDVDHRHSSEEHIRDVHSLGQMHQAYVHPVYGPTVFDDHLICMEDGLSMKMLKRHLLTVHGMTPDQYRAKWNLPDNYPMVAAQYAKLRSNLALESGLGLKPQDRLTRERDSKAR